MSAIEIIAVVLMLAGALFTLISAIGVLRLRDVYSRIHAAGKSSTLGVICLVLATVLYFVPEGLVSARLLLAIVFVFMTAPLSALMISRSAHRTGVPLESNTVCDDLKSQPARQLKK